MRIGISTLHIMPSMPGSPEPYLRNLLDALASLDRENNYIMFIRKDYQKLWPCQPNFTSIALPGFFNSRGFRVMYEQFVLPFVIRRYKIDVFHFPMNIRPVVVPCKSVGTVHLVPDSTWTQSVSLSKRFFYKVFFRLIKRADRLITVSETAKRELVELLGIPESKIDVIYHGVGQEFRQTWPDHILRASRLRYGIKTDYIVSIFTTNAAHKNLLGVVRAFLILKRLYRLPHKLVLVGAIRREDIERLAHEYEITSDECTEIVCTGYVSHRDLPLLFADATVCVNISYKESFGLPVIEAMACGTPVVISNITAMPEVAGGAAVTVNPYRSNEVARAIYEIISSPSLSRALVQRGLVRAQEFTWEQAARQTIEIYKKTLQR